MTISDSCRLVQALLSLNRLPVGITFLLDEESYRAFDAQEKHTRTPYCVAVRKAGQGEGLKMRADHHACGGGATALGFIKPNEDNLSGARRLKMGCFHDLGTSRSISKEMVYCAHTPYGVGISPLNQCKAAPDVVVVVCSPYDAMRILHGHAYYHGFAHGMKTAGLQAICHDCTSFPYEEGRLNISMLCSGTRMLAGWSQDELAVGLPYSLWLDVVDGIRNTVNPYERTPAKKRIAERLQDAGMGELLNIEIGRNYDDGCYKGGRVE